MDLQSPAAQTPAQPRVPVATSGVRLPADVGGPMSPVLLQRFHGSDVKEYWRSLPAPDRAPTCAMIAQAHDRPASPIVRAFLSARLAVRDVGSVRRQTQTTGWQTSIASPCSA